VTDDLSVVEDEIASIDKRWNDLCATVGDRLQTLENIQEEIHRYQVVLRVTQKTLIEIEQIVVVEYMLVMDPNKAKQELAEVKVREKTNISQVSDQSIWNEWAISKGRERECIKFPGIVTRRCIVTKFLLPFPNILQIRNTLLLSCFVRLKLYRVI